MIYVIKMWYCKLLNDCIWGIYLWIYSMCCVFLFSIQVPCVSNQMSEKRAFRCVLHQIKVIPAGTWIQFDWIWIIMKVAQYIICLTYELYCYILIMCNDCDFVIILLKWSRLGHVMKQNYLFLPLNYFYLFASLSGNCM